MGDATGIKNFDINVTFDGMAEQAISITYTDPIVDYYGPEMFFDFSIVPEPATLAMLALGGILIRKRTKR